MSKSYRQGQILKLLRSKRILTQDDLVNIIRRLVALNNGHGRKDDIDHLGNRRVRCVGELIQTQFRVGLLRMERVVKERMSIQEPGQATPNAPDQYSPGRRCYERIFWW